MSGRTFAVIGAGLIGGSIARELAARGARVLVGDRDPAAVRAALDAGVAAAPLPPDFEGVGAASAVFLAVPVGADCAVLAAAADRLRGVPLILNTASVQWPAAEAAVRHGLGRGFLGSHPLAGDHRSGWPASRVGLFSGARVLLCPGAATGAGAIERARRLWESFGALPEVLHPAAHDELLGWASHLPQAVASALAAALSRAGIDAADLGPGGRDATRLAASTSTVWTPILLANADAITRALAAAGETLAELREAVARRDGAAVTALLDEAMTWRTGAAADGAVSDSA